jgi:hypothetical protein
MTPVKDEEDQSEEVHVIRYCIHTTTANKLSKLSLATAEQIKAHLRKQHCPALAFANNGHNSMMIASNRSRITSTIDDTTQKNRIQ